MPRFRFRAQAALDLRVREHDAALRELARAESEQHRAQGELELADRAVIDATRAADDAVRTATSASDLHWYRFWIARLNHERTARVSALEARRAAVATAHTACLAARVKRESLERFRDKAIAAHAAADAEAERKMIDDLATRRYALRQEL